MKRFWRPRTEGADNAQAIPMQRPRILQVHHGNYPAARGGVDRVVYELLATNDGYEPLLFEVGPWTQRHWQTRQAGPLRIHSKRLRVPGLGEGVKGAAAGTAEFAWTLTQLARLLRRERIDLVHLHTLQDYHLYFAILARLGLCRYVITLHRNETLAYPTRSRLRRWRWRQALHNAAGVNTVSHALRELAARTLPLRHPARVIHNGITTPTAGSANRWTLPEWAHGRQLAVCVGALAIYKGHDTAVKAWASIERPRPLLVIVGEGEERDRLQQLALSLGCADDVHLVGARPHDEALAWIQAADVYLMPSRSEGLGIALAEAAALGKAIACSNLPCFREIVQHQTSCLMHSPEDAAALANAVQTLLNDEALCRRLGQGARQAFEQSFTAQQMHRQYAQWYAHLSDRQKTYDKPSDARGR